MKIKRFLLIIGVISSLITVGCSNEKANVEKDIDKPKVVETKTVSVSDTETEKQVGNLGMTPEEFQLRYNTITREKDGDIGRNIFINVQNNNGKKFFNINHGEHMVMRTNIDESTGLVEEVIINATEFANKNEIAKFLYVSDVMIGVSAPNMTIEERENLLFKTIDISTIVQSGGIRSIEIDELFYGASYNEDDGLTFIICNIASL